MRVTEIKVHLIDEEKLKAFVTIVIDDSLVIRDVKIIDGVNGLFLAMPSKKRKNGEYKDVVHPVNQETRKRIEMLVFEEYEAQLSGTTDHFREVS